MSGFVGLNMLFASITQALNINLNQDQKNQISTALYPLSLKNKYLINIDDINQILDNLNILENEESNNTLKRYISKYLNDNIKDMI